MMSRSSLDSLFMLSKKRVFIADPWAPPSAMSPRREPTRKFSNLFERLSLAKSQKHKFHHQSFTIGLAFGVEACSPGTRVVQNWDETNDRDGLCLVKNFCAFWSSTKRKCQPTRLPFPYLANGEGRETHKKKLWHEVCLMLELLKFYCLIPPAPRPHLTSLGSVLYREVRAKKFPHCLKL